MAVAWASNVMLIQATGRDWQSKNAKPSGSAIKWLAQYVCGGVRLYGAHRMKSGLRLGPGWRSDLCCSPRGSELYDYGLQLDPIVVKTKSRNSW
jgi:hypothetical protein